MVCSQEIVKKLILRSVVFLWALLVLFEQNRQTESMLLPDGIHTIFSMEPGNLKKKLKVVSGLNKVTIVLAHCGLSNGIRSKRTPGGQIKQEKKAKQLPKQSSHMEISILLLQKKVYNSNLGLKAQTFDIAMTQSLSIFSWPDR